MPCLNNKQTDLRADIASAFALVERGREDMHDYQDKIAVEFLKKNPFSALFVDLGLGKTIISLTLISDLLDSMSFNFALIVGPLRVVHQTWPNEIPIWRHTAPLSWAMIRDEEVQESVRKAGAVERKKILAEIGAEIHTKGLDPQLEADEIAVLHKSYYEAHKHRIEKARVVASRKAVRDFMGRTKATIHLINREQLEFLVKAWGRDWPYDVVIVDESSSLKDHKSGRFKALRSVRPYIKRMHQLTATPTAEGYMGLFAQMYLLDEGKRLGKNITTYRERYFSRGYDGFSWKLRPGADEEITEKIADICLTLRAPDYLKELKAPVFNPRYVTLSREHREMYADLERDFVMTTPEGAEIEAENAAALSNKLLQFASGSVYDADKKVHPIHNSKIDELHEIVEEANGEPLLVVYWYKTSLDRLQKAFPKAVVMDKEGKAVGKWNSGKIPMLLLHPASAGHGLNLQKGGHHMVFFDIPWSLELYLQTIGRLARQGQQNVVVLHHIICKGTIEEDVVVALREKRDVMELFYKYLKSIRRRLAEAA